MPCRRSGNSRHGGKTNSLGSKVTDAKASSKEILCNDAGTKVPKITQVVDGQRVRRNYTFLKRIKNADYDAGVKLLPIRSCLIHDKSAVFRSPELAVKTRPKWLTDLFCDVVDPETGELIRQEIYRTDEIRSSNNSKIKRLDAFSAHFQPLYQSGRVSILFYTLTVANQAKMPISGVIDVIKKRMVRRGLKVHGYIWTAEVSETLHFHYHVAVAIDRLNVAGGSLPDWLKLDDAWGARTAVEFVRKNIKYYMAKYFAKDNARIIGVRSFGSYILKKK